MGLIASLPKINKLPDSVFVMHEKSEKMIPLHTHTKGQLSYVEGGIAYIIIGQRTYVVPARHYFWIPQGIQHILRIGYSATVLHSLYFYTHDDAKNKFYQALGIYPASELLIQMINYSQHWDGKHVCEGDEHFEFFVALKNLLPMQKTKTLPIILPTTENEQMLQIIQYLEQNISQRLTIKSVSNRFNISERSFSRLFQNTMQISFLQYLKAIRMIKAIELVLKTRKPIGIIADEVGYVTISSFSDAFQEFTHARPSDFRKG